MRLIAEYRPLVLTWLVWVILVLVLIQYLPARFTLTSPDRVLPWTAEVTMPGLQAERPYLNDPFLNGHVAWDSEYYLSIALAGYHDPAMRAIPPDFTWQDKKIETVATKPTWTSLSHAFFPGYPFLVRLVAAPFVFYGMKDLTAAIFAGVVVSLLGALAAMAALYRLGRDLMDQPTGLRASFYLLVAPASMFLAMVYTEGLFLALSFWALVFARERRSIPAGLLAFMATLTKAGGALLLVPLFLYWYQSGSRRGLFAGGGKRAWRDMVFMLAPAIAYAVFVLALSRQFHLVESSYFGRSTLNIQGTVAAWKEAVGLMAASPMTRAYYLVEVASLLAGGASIIWMFRHDKVLALYCGAIMFFSLTSGTAQGMHRYVLALPSFFLLPAALGRYRSFDRAWVMVNLPFMVILMTTFVANQWAG